MVSRPRHCRLTDEAVTTQAGLSLSARPRDEEVFRSTRAWRAAWNVQNDRVFSRPGLVPSRTGCCPGDRLGKTRGRLPGMGAAEPFA
jgi:hypothetical protein